MKVGEMGTELAIFVWLAKWEFAKRELAKRELGKRYLPDDTLPLTPTPDGVARL